MADCPNIYTVFQGDACFRVPKRKKTSVVLIQSFKPTTVSDTRRQIEDYCRDLIINNGGVHLKTGAESLGENLSFVYS